MDPESRGKVMKTRKSLLEKIYEQDPGSKAFIIKISIDHYKDIFNDLDPAPFKIRDLDPDLKIYLEDSSSDIPFKNEIILQFNAPKKIQDNEIEEKVIIGLRTYFQFLIRSFKRDIKRAYKKGLGYILTAFTFLLFAFYLISIIPEDFLYITLVEGLFIGGWVFLWEAIAVFVFKNRDINIQRKRYERFNEATINFVYQ
jgi:hypothetical protein